MDGEKPQKQQVMQQEIERDVQLAQQPTRAEWLRNWREKLYGLERDMHEINR